MVTRLIIRPGDTHRLTIVAARQRRGAKNEYLVYDPSAGYLVFACATDLAARLRRFLPLTARTIAELGFHELTPQPPQACTVTRGADGYTITPKRDNALPPDWRAEADCFLT